jgi:hypothetical protein
VLVQIWLALLVLLLLAAPAGARSQELPDLPSPSGLCDDAAPASAPAPLVVRPPCAAVRPAPGIDREPTAPELARVFRPPRRRGG